MKKAILVPADFNLQRKPFDEPLGNLDAEMLRILQTQSIPSDVKIRQYNQTLQRYMSLKAGRDKPYSLEITETEPSNNLDETILKGLPPTKLELGKTLLDFINKQDNIIVEKNKEVTINGTRIPNSNIIDLVHDLVRDRKTHLPAIGNDKLIHALRLANIPLEYIGNKNRHDLFQTDSPNWRQTPIPPPRPSVGRRIEQNSPRWDEY
jgi:hypothetical protein